MRRSSEMGPQPDEEPTLFERVREWFSTLFDRRGGRQSQALPMSSYRRGGGVSVSSRDRRRASRGRDGQQVGYAIIFVAVLLVLVVGLAWALGGLPFGGSGAPTPVPKGTTVSVGGSPTPPVSLLPTPGPGSMLPSPVAQPIASPSPAVGESTPTRTYVVRQGDTPNSIAQRFGISANELMQANNIQDPKTLRIGQTLTIPPPR